MNQKEQDEIKRDKVCLYSYFAEKLLDHLEHKPNVISIKKIRWFLGIRFRVPKELRPIIIKEMIDMKLLERVSRDKVSVIFRKKILNNISRLYHETGMW